MPIVLPLSIFERCLRIEMRRLGDILADDEILTVMVVHIGDREQSLTVRCRASQRTTRRDRKIGRASDHRVDRADADDEGWLNVELLLLVDMLILGDVFEQEEHHGCRHRERSMLDLGAHRRRRYNHRGQAGGCE
jgi:hypothetical protein